MVVVCPRAGTSFPVPWLLLLLLLVLLVHVHLHHVTSRGKRNREDVAFKAGDVGFHSVRECLCNYFFEIKCRELCKAGRRSVRVP